MPPRWLKNVIFAVIIRSWTFNFIYATNLENDCQLLNTVVAIIWQFQYSANYVHYSDLSATYGAIFVLINWLIVHINVWASTLNYAVNERFIACIVYVVTEVQCYFLSIATERLNELQSAQIWQKHVEYKNSERMSLVVHFSSLSVVVLSSNNYRDFNRLVYTSAAFCRHTWRCINVLIIITRS